MSKWNGRERRNYAKECVNGIGLDIRIDSLKEDINDIKELQPVPFNAFKWSIGLLATTMIALFGISLSISSATQKAITDIKIKQETVLLKLERVEQDVKVIKSTRVTGHFSKEEKEEDCKYNTIELR